MIDQPIDGMLGRGRTVAPVVHGGLDLKELERFSMDPAGILDFSTCVNPFGPSPRVASAIADVPLDQYPDPNQHALRSALAARYELTPRQILIGNGVSELIALAALAIVRPGDRVVVFGPTYGEYARSVLIHGGKLHSVFAREEDGFTIDLDNVVLSECRLVFLCNPNNPTGHIYAPDDILALARRHPHTLLVVDEAYQEFAPGLGSLVTERTANLLVFRSMTKDHALAGLRIGYAVGPEALIKELSSVQTPWSVNALAQAAALTALEDKDHLATSLAKVTEAKIALVQGLTELGFTVVPSAAHFFLMHVGDGEEFRRTLLARGILVRNAASFGLPAYVRLAPRRPRDNEQLLAALREVKW